MKILLQKIFIFLVLAIVHSVKINGQQIVIKDTLFPNLRNETLRENSFIVEGEVIGLDKGSIKLSLRKTLLAHVPIIQGKFFFSGTVDSLVPVRFEIDGDYYLNVFYLEPGIIKIKYIYQKTFTASGTKENDLENYFINTINKKNTDRFYELSNKINLAFKEKNLALYLKLIDSFRITEKHFFQTLNKTIDQKRLGFYLLPYINYYYISYGHFQTRKLIFDRLPENIRHSSFGKDVMAILEGAEIKKKAVENKPAYRFSLKTKDGEMVELSRFKGKTIVLDFWASWCLPCIASLPLLKEIHKNKVSENAVYISVSIDKKEEEWKKKEQSLDIPWLSVLADTSTIEKYDVNAVPAYVVINDQGILINKSTSLGELYSTLKSRSD